MYYDVLINAFYVYTIIKWLAPLVLSGNHKYTGLIRANIRCSKNGVRETLLMEGGYILNREGNKYHLLTLPTKLDSMQG